MKSNKEGCVTCKASLNDGSYASIRRRRLSTNISRGNVLTGEVLDMMGMNVGYRKTWIQKLCCAKCWKLAEKWFNSHHKAEVICQEWYERTGQKAPTMNKKKGQKFKQSAIRMLMKSEYEALIKILMKFSPLFRRAWMSRFQKAISKEMRKLSGMRNLFTSNCNNIKEGSKFHWEEVLKTVHAEAPTVFALLKATLLKDINSSMDELDKMRMGTMVLVPVYHRRPRLQRFIPSVLSTSLWNSGTKGKGKVNRVIGALHGLGVAQSVKTARRNAKKLIRENKRILEDVHDTMKEELQADQTSKESTELHPSYASVIDSIQWLPPTGHAKKDRKNKMRLECNGVAADNGVSVRRKPNKAKRKASKIPISEILPSQTDYESLKARMQGIVERILVNNLKCFQDVPGAVQELVPHTYSDEVAMETEIAILGVVEGNPASAEGTMEILAQLSSEVAGGFPVAVHGDQMTVEVAEVVEVACSNLPNPRSRLKEVAPVPHDFNLRVLVMKDTISQLYSPTNANEVGTMRHLRNEYDHIGVDESMSSFNHADDFCLFICCLTVVGFALDHLHMTSCDDALPADIARPTCDVLKRAARKVVSRIWQQPSINCIADVMNASVEGHEDQFCTCKGEILEADLVECGNMKCEHGRWFHRPCVPYSKGNKGGKWFCSAGCSESGQNTFCLCRMVRKEQLSLTCSNPECPRGKKFHPSCVGSKAIHTSKTSPLTRDRHWHHPTGIKIRHHHVDKSMRKSKWYCSVQCMGARESATYVSENVDRHLLYLETCAWRCLLNEALRDAEREGDGSAAMSHWRILLPELFQKNHTECLEVAHGLLTGTILHTFGRYMPQSVQRTANISDQIRDDFEEILASNVGGGAAKSQDTRQSRYQRYARDVRAHIAKTGTSMFAFKAGRSLESLPNFHPVTELSYEEAQEMKARIVSLNKGGDVRTASPSTATE